MNNPEDEQLVTELPLTRDDILGNLPSSTESLCVLHIPQEGTTSFSISRRVFKYTFSFSLSYNFSTVLVLPSKILMLSGLLCNDSLNRKNKFLRKSKESTATLCSSLGTVRKPCDAHLAALTEFSYTMNV